MFILAAAIAGCDGEKPAEGRGAATQPAQAVAVRVAPISAGSLDVTAEVVGTLFGEEEAIISSKSEGRIVSIDADLGDRVAAGSVLAQVDPTDYHFTVEQRQLALREQLAKLGLTEMPPESFDPTTVATVQRAAVQTENAKARLDRASQLYKQSPPLISEQEYADIETQYRVFQRDYDVAVLEAQGSLASAKSLDAALRIAQQQLDDTTVRVPQSRNLPPDTQYAVAERRVSIGELVQPGTTMYKVIADRTVKLRASVAERFAGQVLKDQPVSLRVESSPQVFSGKVWRVSPGIDVNSRTFSIEAVFDNQQGQLRPGAFARGAVTIGTRSDVTIVPPAALFSFAGLEKVFTVADGKAVEHRVVVLERSDKRIVVEGDLGGSKQAIVSGLARLSNGAPITIETK
jgi:RND family efflux transporter MFP subunit